MTQIKNNTRTKYKIQEWLTIGIMLFIVLIIIGLVIFELLWPILVGLAVFKILFN